MQQTAFHPDFGSEVSALIEDRPTLEDEAFTSQTIARMCQYAIAAARDSRIRQAAKEAVGGHLCQAAQAGAIWKWIRERIRFVRDAELAVYVSDDPENAELLIPPADLLSMSSPAGDCDDFSMLAAAMLLSLGFPVCFRTVAADPQSDRYSHVYPVAETEDGRLPLDCSHGPYPGWEVKASGKTRDWPIEERMNNGSLGSANWGSIAQNAFQTAGSILQARYGQPNINPGTYIDQRRGIMYRQQPGATDLAFPGVNVDGSWTTGIVLVGAAVLLIVLMAGKR